MHLLICTQKVDKNDPILSFFHRWIEEFSRHYAKISVICLEMGEHELPSNVTVYSLGKEDKRSRFQYVLRFFKFVWILRHQYQSVFVHMNQEYVLLGGLFWRCLGKHILLWRNHPAHSFLTRIAVGLSHDVFYTSKESYTARFSKAHSMPVGVDTELFKPTKGEGADKASLLSLGRVEPIKNVDLIIKAVSKLQEKYPLHLDIYGEASEECKEYEYSLKEETQHSFFVKWRGSVSNEETPSIYRSHVIFINATDAGTLDKTIFEAMASGCLVVTSNPSLRGKVDDRLLFKENDLEQLMDSLETILTTSDDEKIKLRETLREFVVTEHSLEKLASRVKEIITEHAHEQ